MSKNVKKELLSTSSFSGGRAEWKHDFRMELPIYHMGISSCSFIKYFEIVSAQTK